MKLGFLLLVIRYVHLGTLMWPLLCSTNHFYHRIHHIFDKMIPVDSLKVSQVLSNCRCFAMECMQSMLCA